VGVKELELQTEKWSDNKEQIEKWSEEALEELSKLKEDVEEKLNSFAI
jgi:ABC-type Zn uptake system ZnuABC Zn-binding protein ZnuA